MNHDMGLKEFETYTRNFKAGYSSTLPYQFYAEHPLEINSKLVVSLTLPKETKS
jgi:hypothetical protein